MNAHDKLERRIVSAKSGEVRLGMSEANAIVKEYAEAVSRLDKLTKEKLELEQELEAVESAEFFVEMDGGRFED